MATTVFSEIGMTIVGKDENRDLLVLWSGARKSGGSTFRVFIVDGFEWDEIEAWETHGVLSTWVAMLRAKEYLQSHPKQIGEVTWD